MMVSLVVRHDALKRIGRSNLADRGYAHITPPCRKMWSIYASRGLPERVLRCPKAEIDCKTVLGLKGCGRKAGRESSDGRLDALPKQPSQAVPTCEAVQS